MDVRALLKRQAGQYGAVLRWQTTASSYAWRAERNSWHPWNTSPTSQVGLDRHVNPKSDFLDLCLCWYHRVEGGPRIIIRENLLFASRIRPALLGDWNLAWIRCAHTSSARFNCFYSLVAWRRSTSTRGLSTSVAAWIYLH